jgi:hypothetical protein
MGAKMKKNEIRCPRCDQDYISLVEVIKLKKNIYWCPECDSSWLSEGDILNVHPFLLIDFFDDNNLMLDPRELKIIVGDPAP